MQFILPILNNFHQFFSNDIINQTYGIAFVLHIGIGQIFNARYTCPSPLIRSCFVKSHHISKLVLKLIKIVFIVLIYCNYNFIWCYSFYAFRIHTHTHTSYLHSYTFTPTPTNVRTCSSNCFIIHFVLIIVPKKRKFVYFVNLSDFYQLIFFRHHCDFICCRCPCALFLSIPIALTHISLSLLPNCTNYKFHT